MSAPFALVHAWRETRASARRLGLYMGAITLGVAALVAINSFRANVTASIQGQARELLGADLRLSSSSPFPASVAALVDSLSAAGDSVARVTGLVSMALAPRTGATRLIQLRAVEPGWPFYGDVPTEPAGLWSRFRASGDALVDPALLVQLGVRIGDTLSIGQSRFRIAGTVDAPAEIGFQTAVGPRVFIGSRQLAATGLVRFGTLARYEAYVRMPARATQDAFTAAHRDLLREQHVGVTTAEDRAENLTEDLGNLSRFLGLIGLTALLLGGIGVASAIHVFIKEKIPTVAVLRCLGARQRTVFGAYLLQAAALGLAGSAAGVLVGIAAQAALPAVLRPFLPVDVGFSLNATAIVAGLVVGLWVAAIFALIPLLSIRDVTPLQALRQGFEPAERARDPLRGVAYGALAASILALSIWQAPTWRTGLAFACGLAVTVGVLWLVALGVVRATRRFFPTRARYVVRQGVSNLFRPHNQTVAVTLSLGFGVFLIGTMYLVQRNLLDKIRLRDDTMRANVLLFDVQPDQVRGVDSLFTARGAPLHEITPIVPARIAAVNGRSVQQILADTTIHRHRWALRREFRNTYRDTMTATERITAGHWFRGPHRAGQPARISVDEGVAQELGVGLGDTITWNFNGASIPSVVTSLRHVDWGRFAPNFFVVFEPGVLDQAPQTVVALARIADATRRAEVQRDLVQRYPNVSVLDLQMLQRTLDSILSRVALAIRFLALFSIGGGVLVLIGALATSRFQRTRESALLKTLGASRRQIRTVLLTEYLALGVLAALTGSALAGLAGWALVSRFFHLPFRLPVPGLLLLWAGVAALTVAVGLFNSRDVLRKAPLVVLREISE